MKRYKQFLNWIHVLALFSAIFVAERIIHAIEEIALPWYAPIAVIGISVLLVFHVTEFVATGMFERFSWLRRFVLADEWIEGVWFDFVSDTDRFALVIIHQTEGEPAITSELFDEKARVRATSESFIVSVDGRTIRAIFRSPQFEPNRPPTELIGFTTYVFSGPPHHPPSYYNGYFADLSASTKKHQLRGFRIEDPKQIEKLMHHHNKQAAVLELISQYRTSFNSGAQVKS